MPMTTLVAMGIPPEAAGPMRVMIDELQQSLEPTSQAKGLGGTWEFDTVVSDKEPKATWDEPKPTLDQVDEPSDPKSTFHQPSDSEPNASSEPPLDTEANGEEPDTNSTLSEAWDFDSGVSKCRRRLMKIPKQQN